MRTTREVVCGYGVRIWVQQDLPLTQIRIALMDAHNMLVIELRILTRALCGLSMGTDGAT